MSDHYHYGYADERHSHSEYANERHDHAYDYAEKYHSHYDTESTVQGLRQDLNDSLERIWHLEQAIEELRGWIEALTPRPQPQLHDGDPL